jgi:sulfur carrier protein
MSTATLNGKPIDLAAATPLTELLLRHNIRPDDAGIAVAVNGAVVRRALWPQTVVNPNDHVEVVHARQGG